MDFLYRPLRTAELRGQPLLLPTLSVGSTGQLALDLLLNTQAYGFAKVGWVHSVLLLPVAGYQPLDWNESDALAYPAEVYTNGELVVLQIRSLLVQNSFQDFISALLHWTNDVGISELIVFGSNAAANRPNPDQGRVYYLKNERSTRIPQVPQGDFNPELLLGVGLLKKLLKLRELPVTALVCYSDWQVDVQGCQELLATFVASWGLQAHQVQMPKSWQALLV